METQTVEKVTKYWYLPLVLGVLFIGAGVFVLFTPLASYLTLSFLFALTLLIGGALEVIYAIANRDINDRWGWTLVGGLLDLVIGILLVSNPALSAVVLLMYIGFALLFRAIMGIAWAVELKRAQVPNWGALMTVSIIGLILVLVMLWNPVFLGLTVVVYTALALVTVGAASIARAIFLKRVRNRFDF